ncbi:MAG: MarR family transcriptional regulator [Acidobacteriaceae bacterium]
MTKPNRTANIELAKRQVRQLAEFRYQVRNFLHFSERAARAAGLQPQQYQLLQAVAAVPEEQTPTIAYVAEKMMLRHNSAVELVDRTQKLGLLKRQTDAEDHRKVDLKLTAKGEKKLYSLVAAHIERLQENGPEMMQAFRAALKGVTNGAAAQKSPAKSTRQSK